MLKDILEKKKVKGYDKEYDIEDITPIQIEKVKKLNLIIL